MQKYCDPRHGDRYQNSAHQITRGRNTFTLKLRHPRNSQLQLFCRGWIGMECLTITSWATCRARCGRSDQCKLSNEWIGTATTRRRTTNDERRTTNDERRTTNDERRTTNDERNEERCTIQFNFHRTSTGSHGRTTRPHLGKTVQYSRYFGYCVYRDFKCGRLWAVGCGLCSVGHSLTDCE